MTRWIPWVLASVGVMPLGCSKAIEGGVGGTGPTSTGVGGAPGVGGSGMTSSTGGAGGAGGEGGQAPLGPCGIDCSTIQVPQCLQGVCDEQSGSCVVVPSPGGEACDDGEFCTVGEVCAEGVCGGGADNTCGLTPGDCEVVLCSEGGDSCALVPKADGAACTSADLCVINAACQAGLCVGVPKDCFFAPVPDSCKVAQCNPATGACEPMPGHEGAACSDSGDMCMTGKTCQGGYCLGGTPKSCNHLSVGCTNGVCDPGTGQCYGQAVQPGDACLQVKAECQVGVCTPSGQCAAVTQGDGTACDDSNSCTLGDACQAGACQGTPMAGYVVYFSEDFSDNAAGWTFVPGTKQTDNMPIQEWAIGPAMASTGTHSGNHDPASDTSPTLDNGIAGVVIGGFATRVVHSMNYIESPAINTSGAPGSVYLQFRRWLNSDSGPTFMVNRIEAYNGSIWTTVWESGSTFIYDAQWQHVSHNLTAFKSASMKIRFGFRVGSTAAATVGSWNIDDVIIANQDCSP